MKRNIISVGCFLIALPLQAVMLGEGIALHYNFDALSKTGAPFQVPGFIWDEAEGSLIETGDKTLTLSGSGTYEAGTNIGARRWEGNCSLNGAYASVRLTQPFPDFTPPAEGSWTIAFWLGRDSATSRPILLSQGAYTAAFTEEGVKTDNMAAHRKGFAFYTLTNNKIAFRYFTEDAEGSATLGALVTGSTYSWGASLGTVNIGWHHVAVVCNRNGNDEGTLTLYVNGIREASASIPAQTAIVAPVGSTWEYQFNSSTNGSSAMGAENALDDITLWTRALSKSEAAFLGGRIEATPLMQCAAQTAPAVYDYTRALTGSGNLWSTEGIWTVDEIPGQNWVGSGDDSVTLTISGSADLTPDIPVTARSLTTVAGETPAVFTLAASEEGHLTVSATTLATDTVIEPGAVDSLGTLSFTASSLTLPDPTVYSGFTLANNQSLVLRGGPALTSLPAFPTLFANGGRLIVQKDVSIANALAATANNQKLNITILGGALTAPRFVGGQNQNATTDVIVNGGTLNITGSNKTFSVTAGDGAVFLGNWNAACTFRLRSGKFLVENGVVNIGRDSNVTFEFATDAADSADSEARFYGFGTGSESRSTTGVCNFGNGTVIIGKGGISIPSNQPNKRIVLTGPVTFTTYADSELPEEITDYTGWTMAASHASGFQTTATGTNAPTLDPRDKLIRINAVISGNGDLNIGSPGTTGTVVFGANNVYTGTTTVSGGTLVINAAQTGAVTVKANAAVSGGGTLNSELVFETDGCLLATKPDASFTGIIAAGSITLPETPIAVDVSNAMPPEAGTPFKVATLLAWTTEPEGSFVLTGDSANAFILKKTAAGLDLCRRPQGLLFMMQ